MKTTQRNFKVNGMKFTKGEYDKITIALDQAAYVQKAEGRPVRAAHIRRIVRKIILAFHAEEFQK